MKFLKSVISLAAALLVPVSLVGCTEESSLQTEQRRQEALAKEANAQVGMPAITRFFEKRQLKLIQELRDNPDFVTYTYVMVPGTGKRRKVCPNPEGKSIGFGIPYSTQFTSPEKIVERLGTPVTVPQADPNGLYTPPSSDATWVICVHPEGKDPFPLYEENRITTSPIPLPE